MGVIGGMTPLVATWLVDRTQHDFSPAWLVMGAAALTFISMLSFEESYLKSIVTA
jgi:MHS family proline/betaine transporter-like MFS transporter